MSSGAKRKTAEREKYRDAPRTRPFMLVELTAEQEDRLAAAELACQKALNRFYFEFRRLADERGYTAVMQEWLARHKPWLAEREGFMRSRWAGWQEDSGKKAADLSDKERKTLRKTFAAEAKEACGEMPECPIAYPAFNKDFSAELRGRMAAAVPNLHDRALTLLLHNLTHDLAKHQAERSWYKRWHLMLADLGGNQPVFSGGRRGTPIPVNTSERRARLLAPDDPDDDDAIWELAVRLDRFRIEGRDNGYTSTLDRFRLATRGRRNGQLRWLLRELVFGRLKLHSGRIRRYEGRWYFDLTYQDTVWTPSDVDRRRRAMIWPGTEKLWHLEIAGREINVRQSAWRLLRWHRTRLLARRRSRSKEIMHGRLNGFKRTLIKQTVSQVITIMEEYRAGTLLYRDPTEAYQPETALATIGRDGKPDSWPWYQQKTEFSCQLQRRGMKFVVESFGGSQSTTRDAGK